MWLLMVLLVPVLLPTLVIKKITCDNHTDDVIVRYSGHAEADTPLETSNYRISSEIPTTLSTATTTLKPSLSPIFSTTTTTTTKRYEEETESVVFIPNDPPVVRLEDESDRHAVKIHDLMARREMIDALDKQFKAETDPPKDVVFIVDKNKDIHDVQTNSRRSNAHTDHIKPTAPKPENCTNLDCANNVQTICGKKQIEGKTQFRLFLNDCYFKKVNCKFKYRKNRYTKTTLSKCSRIGSHNVVPPSNYAPRIPEPDTRKKKKKVTRTRKRNYSSRRSLAMDAKGEFCSHACPTSCSENYDPVCAISATGRRKVFMNHCRLDDNSCQFAVVWHKRPLSECVGGKKADLQHNRHFVAWLQRVGLVDNKGKIVSD